MANENNDNKKPTPAQLQKQLEAEKAAREAAEKEAAMAKEALETAQKAAADPPKVEVSDELLKLKLEIPNEEGDNLVFREWAGKVVSLTKEALKKTDVKWAKNHYRQEFQEDGSYTLEQLMERPGVLIAAQIHHSGFGFNLIKEAGTQSFKRRFAKKA